MSLLPQQIIPETVPLGTVGPDGRVRIDHNWWLFLYNLFLNVLGSGASGSLPADALIDLESADVDAIDADAIALRAPVAALATVSDDFEALRADVAQLRAQVAALQVMLAVNQELEPFGAAPAAKVGLAAVAGGQQTFMRSDAAPPIDQSIAPNWTGQHIFSGGIEVNGNGGNATLTFTGTGAYSSIINLAAAGGGSGFIQLNSAFAMTIASGGKVSLSVHYTSGWGTPTGNGVIANFPAATATLAQTAEVVAQILTDLKAFGLYGA